MEVYILVAGIILMILGFSMIFRWLDFLLIRYEVFQKFVRRKEISVERDALSKFYSILFFVLSVPLIVGAIFGLLYSEIPEMVFVWILVGVAALGVVGILYCNISSRFIIYDTNKLQG